MTTPQDAANYIRDLADYRKFNNIIPITLTIDNTSYSAVQYTQTLQYDSTCRIVTEGKAKPGDEYQRTAIYAIGNRPKDHRRGEHIAFNIEGDDKDYYIAGYYVSESSSENSRKFHPLGNNFIVMAWDSPGTIDQYEAKPYKRISMTITPV